MTYYVNPGTYYGETGSFTLSVTTGGGGVTTPVPAGELTGNGGSAQINGTSNILFTPNKTGLWIVYTANNGSDDPMLTMYYPDGSILADNDDGWGDYNALLAVFLAEGSTYTIETGFYGSSSGTCTLFVIPPADFNPGGGSVQVNGPTGFMFVPSQSGTYEFRTSDNGNSDPYLHVFDPYESIAENDDDGGNFNAYLTVSLEAGVEYDIYVGFWGPDGQSTGIGYCTLTVNRR